MMHGNLRTEKTLLGMPFGIAKQRLLKTAGLQNLKSLTQPCVFRIYQSNIGM